MFQSYTLTNPIYLPMLLGLGGVYVLVSSFHDVDDGEKYINNPLPTNLAK